MAPSHDPPCTTGNSTRNKRGQCISKMPQTVWGKYQKYQSVDENDENDDDDDGGDDHKLRNGDQLVGRLICRDFWASQKVLFELF